MSRHGIKNNNEIGLDTSDLPTSEVDPPRSRNRISSRKYRKVLGKSTESRPTRWDDSVDILNSSGTLFEQVFEGGKEAKEAGLKGN